MRCQLVRFSMIGGERSHSLMQDELGLTAVMTPNYAFVVGDEDGASAA